MADNLPTPDTSEQVARRRGPAMTMPDLPVLRAGIWRHYRGHLYLVLGYANDANQEDRTVVVYVGLDLDGARHGERISVRTVEDFFADVDPATGKPVGDRWDDLGHVPRFTYVGPTVDLPGGRDG